MRCLLAALCFVLVACPSTSGGVGPQGPAGPTGPTGATGPTGPAGTGASPQVNGSRLNALYLSGSDGSRLVYSTLTGPYFDARFGELCALGGGLPLRCLPVARQLTGEQHSGQDFGFVVMAWCDSACSQPLVTASTSVVQTFDAGVAHYVTQNTVRMVLEPFAGDFFLSQLDGGACHPAPTDGGFLADSTGGWFKGGTQEVSLTEFVSFEPGR